MLQRELILQRNMDIDKLSSICDVVPLLQEVGLLSIVENVGPYSKLLTCEFYCNLTNSMNDATSPRHYNVFIRGKWYTFSPQVINEFYGLEAKPMEKLTNWDQIDRAITGKTYFH